MQIKNIYNVVKKSSGGKVLKYNLCEDNNSDEKCYGIEVLLEDNGLAEREIIKDISNDKSEVLSLIDYLYENGVDIVHFREVVEDYIVR